MFFYIYYNFIVIFNLFNNTAILHKHNKYDVSITIALNGGVCSVLKTKLTSPVSRFATKNTNNWFRLIEEIIVDDVTGVNLALNSRARVCVQSKKTL